MKISLLHPGWQTNEIVWVTGYIWSGANYLVNGELIDYFTGAEKLSDFIELLSKANGQFSVIIKSSDEIWAATDRLRNYPLFYTYSNEQYIISDDCYTLGADKPDLQLDIMTVNSFLSSGYVINNNTLIKDIYQVEAGSYIVLGDTFKSGFYYNPCIPGITDKNFNTLSEELAELISVVFNNHLKALHDKFLAVPLSGGFDSRLIATMCARYHPENLLCYTYGAENNPEVNPAREVAKRLRLKWINIIYDSALISGYINDDIFKSYYPFASNLSSMFFMQEYFAVKYLKENNLIPDNTVFVPGFSGDVLAGNHLTPEMKKHKNRDQISTIIYKEFFGLIKLNRQDKSEITELIKLGLPANECDTWKVIESWDRKERQAKFVVNSARIFSFFGYDYIVPLWDNRLADFFSDLPFEMKLNKKLYDSVLTNVIFKEFNINLDKEINPLPAVKTFQRFKGKIKPILPDSLRHRFIHYKSPILYDEITRLMTEDLGASNVLKPAQTNYYNSYITQWYLAKTRELLNI